MERWEFAFPVHGEEGLVDDPASIVPEKLREPIRFEFGWNVRFLNLWPLWADGWFAPQETSQSKIREDLAGNPCVFEA